MAAKRLDRKMVAQIERWLSEWSAGHYGSKLTWEKLAVYTGFSRQALSANPKVAQAFRDAKAAIRRKEFAQGVTGASKDRTDRRIDELNERIAELERQAENWASLWERWRYNARQEGWNTALLDRDLPKPIHRKRARH